MDAHRFTLLDDELDSLASHRTELSLPSAFAASNSPFIRRFFCFFCPPWVSRPLLLVF